MTYTFTYVSGGTTHRVTSGAGVSYDYNNGVVSASTLGTTEKSRTLIRTIKVTLSYVLNGQTYTGSTTANVYQEANIATQEYLVKIWGTRGYEDQQTAFSYTFVNGNTSYDGDALGFSPFIWNDYKFASDIPIYLTLAERSTYSSGEIGNYIALTPSLIRTDNINGTGSLLDAYQMEISFTPNLFPKNLEGDIVISGNDTEEFTIKMTQVRTSYYLFVGGTYTPFDENCECTVSNSFKSDEESYTFKICGDPEGSDGYPDGDPVFVSDSQFELDEQPSWITYRQDDDETIIVTFEENITGSIRNGQLVFGYAQERHGLNPYLSEGGRFKFYVNVAQATQQGVLEISPSIKTITGTGTLQFTVKSSSNWTAELQRAILGGKSPYTYATINPSSGIAGEQLITVNIFDNHEDTSSTAATISRSLIVRCENQEGAHDTANITQLGVLHRAYNLCVNRDGYYSCMAGGVASNNPYFEISDEFKAEGDSFKFQIRNMENGTLLESSEEPTMALSPSNAGKISYANGEFSVEINEGNVASREITAKVTYNDEIHSYFNGPYSIKFSQEAAVFNGDVVITYIVPPTAGTSEEVTLFYTGGSQIVGFKVDDDDTIYDSSTTSMTLETNVLHTVTYQFKDGLIDLRTFMNCDRILKAEIGESINTINGYAFQGCEILTAVTLPDTLVKLGENVFLNSSIKNPVIPDSVTEMGNGCFRSCEHIDTCTIGSGLTEIPRDTFYLSNISAITIPSNIETIGYSAFGSCNNLQSVEFEEGCQVISEYAFQLTDKLVNIELPNSLREIGMGAFEDSGLKYVAIPTYVEEIGNNAFGYCDDLTGVSIGAKIVGEAAFFWCTGLTSVDMNRGVEEIGVSCFTNCPKLNSISLPSTIKSIGTRAFSSLPYGFSLTCMASTPPAAADEFIDISNWQGWIYVPSGSVTAYKTASGWSNYASRIIAA